jgi:hypothetical protein
VSDSTTSTARDPKPAAERVQQLARRVLDGDIILPEFQRPFVWKPKQIIDLLDSIYRNFPIGSVLVWESRQQLASKRTIADLQIRPRSDAYPVNYLLDGQQRLSTICGALNWSPGNPRSVWNVVFDLKTQKFFHVDHVDELPIHQIPIRRLSDPATYYRRLAPLDDEALSVIADRLFNRFKDYQVPVVTMGDMSIKDVAPVFERINSTGTRLTIFDLMRAATWSLDFDLGRTIDDVRKAMEPKKFSGLDNKTFLRALGAAAGNDFSAESIDALRHKKTDDLAAAAIETKEAAKRSADFLSTHVGVPRAEALPYTNQFAVLCEIFRLVKHPTSRQLDDISYWFWGSTLSGYFGGWDNGQMAADAKAIRDWAAQEERPMDIGFVTPTASLWVSKTFRANSAVSKMLALMLAHARPVDLLNGQQIDTDKSLAWSNDKEYHHFFPQAYMQDRSEPASRYNAMANIVLLTSESNIKINHKPPSVYLREIVDAVGRRELERRLELSLVPATALDAALADDFDTFLKERAGYLHGTALDLARAGEMSKTAVELLEDSDEDPNE